MRLLCSMLILLVFTQSTAFGTTTPQPYDPWENGGDYDVLNASGTDVGDLQVNSNGTLVVTIGGQSNNGTWQKKPNGRYGFTAGNAQGEFWWDCELGKWRWTELVTMQSGDLRPK